MGWFGDLCVGIKSAWEGVKTVVKGVAKVGSAVLAVAKPIAMGLAIIAPQIGLPLQKVLAIGEKVVGWACVATGIMDASESVADIGAHALEAGEQGIQIEDYDNEQEYLDTIRQVKVTHNWNDEEKAVAGMGVMAYILEKKFDLSPEVYPLFVRYNKFFTKDRVDAITEYAIETNNDLSHLGDCFSSNTTMQAREQAQEFMEKAMEKQNSHFDREKFEEDLLNAKLEKTANES